MKAGQRRGRNVRRRSTPEVSSLPEVPAPPLGGLFGGLIAETPLALFPVRLEARWLPDGNPTEIVVRIFPDEITIDRHQPGLTQTELVLAKEFWKATWRAAGTQPAVDSARRWLSDHLGPYRAAYVARITTPTNSEQAPKKPVDVLEPPPALPAVDQRSQDQPGHARLLPKAFVAYVRSESDQVGPFRARFSVRSPLPASPAMVDMPADGDIRDFLNTQGLGWTHDLEAAERAGLVIRIPVASLPDDWNTSGFRQDIVVVGVADGTDHDAALAELLESHRATIGLEFLNPGDPTNRVDGAAVPATDLLGSRFDSELALPSGKPDRAVASSFDLAANPNGDAAALAFGLDGWTALDRADRAAEAPSRDALAINQFLFPGTLGRWLSDPMSWHDTGDPFLEGVAGIRDWYVNHVRPNGPLPTLLVGKQPYGLLPVMRFRAHADPVNESQETEDLFHQLRRFMVDWDGPAIIDPDDTDRAPRGEGQAAEITTNLAAVWGATPHARDFRLRGAYLDFEGEPDSYLTTLGFAKFLAGLADIEAGFDVYVPMFDQREELLDGILGIESQIETIDDLIAELRNSGTGGSIADYLDDVVRPTLTDHQWRIENVREYVDRAGAESRLHPDAHAPHIYYAAYDATTADANVIAGVAPDAAGASLLRAELETLRGLAEQPAQDRQVPSQSETAPLLIQLGRNALSTMADSTAPVFIAGVDGLIDIIDNDPDNAVQRIEWLVRSGLGPALYRLDAWTTALALERLGTVRSLKGTGLQVGSYGWLTWVRERTGPASQGFIHAPSLDHATTAAVLRSGWSAFGTGAGGSALAVDLSAPRLRAARTVIDGIRAGHDIGLVIGSRLEERLDERGLSQYIDDVRGAVADAVADAAGQPRTSIVDGLIAARAYTDGIERTPAEERARTNLEAIVADAGPALEKALVDAAADIDAVADAMTAQAVHAVLRGDDAVASATLNSIGTGDTGIPPLSIGETGRGGRVCNHRIVGFIGAAETGSWPASTTATLAVADPAAEAWAARLLGPPQTWRIRTAPDAAAVALSSLELCALDIVYRSDDLGTLFREATASGEDAEVLYDEELAVLALRIRHHLGRIRPLNPSDLVAAGTIEANASPAETAPAADVAALEDRLAAVLATLDPADPRHQAATEHEAATSAEWDELAPNVQAELLRERIVLAAGAPVPVLVPIDGGLPSELEESFSQRGKRRNEAMVAGWLLQLGRVNSGVQTLLDAAQLAEVVTDRIVLEPWVAQLPGSPTDPWIALEPPEESGATTSWCAITGKPPAGAVTGFVVDAVVDTVPVATQATGIAIHHDRPSAQAPHAVLLAVTRPGTPFTAEEVVGVVQETLDEVMSRSLPADRKEQAGQVFPAVFLDEDVAIGEVSP